MSHDLSSVALDKITGSIKYGVGELAMQATSRGINTTLLPVGLNYDDKTHFRSSVLISYGCPIRISAEDAAEYLQWKEDNPDGHARDNPATIRLLHLVQEGIESVIVLLSTPT